MVTQAALTSGSAGSTASSFTTASVTPSANRLQLLAVEIGKETTGVVTSFTSVSGNGLTWVEVAKVGVALNSGSNYNAQLSLYRAMGGSPTAGTITINPGFNCVSCAWSLVEFDGVDTTGTNGSGAIAQVVTNKAEGVTSITATLAGFSSQNNATYGAFGASDSGGVPRTFTPGSGFTEIHDTGATFSAVATEFRGDNDTTVDATASASTNIGVIAVEIKAAASPAGITDRTGSTTALTITLDNLANGSTATSSAINIAGATAPVLDVMADVTIANIIQTGNAQVVVYGASSTDGTNYADSTNLNNLNLLGTVDMTGSTGFTTQSLSVAAAYNVLPPAMKLVVHNDAGVALAASGNTAQYRFVYENINTSTPTSLSTVSYSVSTAQIPNPERGFYMDLFHLGNWTQSNLSTYFNTDATNPDNYQRDVRLIHYYCLMNNYKTVDLDATFLNALQSNFNAARTRGMKIILRVSYDQNSAVGASLAQIQRHADQLQPYFASNADILMMVQCGWVGQWGEYQGSGNADFGSDNWPDSLNTTTRTNRCTVIQKTLQILPANRFVQVRQPYVKGMYNNIKLGGALGNVVGVQDAAAFNGSDWSRIGHFDDSFCVSQTDRGTFVYPPFSPSASYNAFNEDTFMRQDTKWVPHGGETNIQENAANFNATYNGGVPAIAFMTKYHTTYLNCNYDRCVLNIWANRSDTSAGSTSGYNTGTNGYYIDQIKKKLGYRLELISSTMPSSATSGTSIPVTIIVNNSGFAAPCMPRPVKLVLRHTVSGAVTTLSMVADPRKWLPGSQITVNENVTLPVGMASGAYAVYLLLPDPDSALSTRPEYAIRFANTGLWDSATGRNALNQTIQIS